MMVYDPVEVFKKCNAKVLSECGNPEDWEKLLLLMKSCGKILVNLELEQGLPALGACLRSNPKALNSLIAKISTEYPTNYNEINEVRLLSSMLLRSLQNKSLIDICYHNEDMCSLAIYVRLFLMAITKDMEKAQLIYLLDLLGKKQNFFYKCLAIKIYIHNFKTLENNFWEWSASPFLGKDFDFFQWSVPNAPLTYPGLLAELLRELLDRNETIISKEKLRERIFRLDRREKNYEYYAAADAWNNVIKGLIPVNKEEQKKCVEKNVVEQVCEYLHVKGNLISQFHHKSPDFILKLENRKIGIEVTRIDSSNDMQERGIKPADNGFYVDHECPTKMRLNEIIEKKSENEQLNNFDGDEVWLIIYSELLKTKAEMEICSKIDDNPTIKKEKFNRVFFVNFIIHEIG